MNDLEILPEERKNKLVDDGYVQIQNGSIKYLEPDYSDNLEDPEEQVRADLFLDLVTELGYESENIEIEKYHKIGHPFKKTDAKIDLIVKDDEGKPFLIAELKSPDDYEKYLETSIKTQLFNIAAVENQEHSSVKYLVYYTRYWQDGELIEKLVCIDYEKYKNFEDWNSAGRPNLRGIPENYGIVRVPVFLKGSEDDLRKNFQKDELQRIRKDLHNILWGGGQYQNELFFNLVGLFLVKIYDEKETEVGEAYDFQIFFEDGEPEDPESVYDRMNSLYFVALEEYLGYTDRELNKIKDIVFNANKVRYVVEVLQEISFTVNKFDVIGDFFEGIVRGEFKQSKGQYLTHTNLIRFMVKGLKLGDLAIEKINEDKSLPYIIDPACGSGAFLIEAMKHITKHILTNEDQLKTSSSVQEFVKSSFPEFRRNAWAKDYIYGIEINGDLAIATKVNMVGHGDGSANIEAKDSLLSFTDFSLGLLQISKEEQFYPKPVNEQFDVIMSNPPFSVTVDRDTAKTFPENYIKGEDLASSLKKKQELEVSTELLFIERYYQLLNPNGRLAVVLPESVFDTSSTLDTRIFMFKYFKIYGIISLTDEAFAPYTTTKTNILFAQKKTEEEIEKWENKWELYENEYEDLSNDISKYTDKPKIYTKITEIVKKLREDADIPEDGGLDENFEDDLAEEIMEYIEGNKEDENVKEKTIEYLKSLFDDFEDPIYEELEGIVDRKRSLPPSIDDYVNMVKSKDDFVEKIKKLLGDFFDQADESLALEDMVEKYEEEIRYASKDWWVFRQVSEEILDYDITLSHAEYIGYKRGVRGEEEKPNELFNEVGSEIIVDEEDPQKILDEIITNIDWD